MREKKTIPISSVSRKKLFHWQIKHSRDCQNLKINSKHVWSFLWLLLLIISKIINKWRSEDIFFVNKG